jgi:cobalt-zinc-cadmium efflux system protein
VSEYHHHHDLGGKNLFIAILLNIIITLAQIAGGIISGSLALLSDALHNFSDVLSLVISYVANRMAKKEGNLKHTFGYKRAEIIATLFNASALVGIGFYIIFEAVTRLIHPESIDSQWVVWLGLLGVIVNGGSIFLLHDDSKESMNIKAAYLHLLGDVLTSVAVVIGGLLMQFWHIYWVDPVISILIAVYLMWASFGLIKESTAILMQFAPQKVDIKEAVGTITRHPEIDNVHHLHLWNLDDHRIHLEAHLDFIDNVTLQESNILIERLEKEMHEQYGIDHTTFQCEYHRNDKKTLIA